MKGLIWAENVCQVLGNKANIMSVKVEDKYSILTMDDEAYIIRRTLGELKESLGEKFIQTHRSYLVNTDYIKEVKDCVYLRNNQEIPISSRKKKEIKNFFLPS